MTTTRVEIDGCVGHVLGTVVFEDVNNETFTERELDEFAHSAKDLANLVLFLENLPTIVLCTRVTFGSIHVHLVAPESMDTRSELFESSAIAVKESVDAGLFLVGRPDGDVVIANEWIGGYTPPPIEVITACNPSPCVHGKCTLLGGNVFGSNASSSSSDSTGECVCSFGFTGERCNSLVISTTAAAVANTTTSSTSSTSSTTVEPTTGVPECSGFPAQWSDTYGASCSKYAEMQWCSVDGATGPGWDERWGKISSFGTNGQNALEACCECGGGVHVEDSINVDGSAVKCLHKCGIDVDPVCAVDQKETFINECWATCMGSPYFVGGECSKPGDVVLIDTADNGGGGGGGSPLPVIKSAAQWDCITLNCDNSDLPVCFNGIQYINRCWAGCMDVSIFEKCAHSILAAGVLPLTTSPAATSGSTYPPASNARQCCFTETALFDGQIQWVSDESCRRPHKVERLCGAGRTGSASRVCTTDGTWLPEEVLDCVNTEIKVLATELESPALPLEVIAALLAKILVEIIRGGASLGKKDVQALITILQSLVDSGRFLTKQLVQLVLDVVSQLMESAPTMSLTAGQEGLPEEQRFAALLASIGILFAKGEAAESGKSEVHTLRSLTGNVWQELEEYRFNAATWLTQSKFVNFVPTLANVTAKIELDLSSMNPYALSKDFQTFWISTIYYKDDSLFNNGLQIGGRPVLSVSTEAGAALVEALATAKVVYEFTNSVALEKIDNAEPVCTSWDSAGKQSNGYSRSWDASECVQVSISDETVRCQCEGIGSFSIQDNELFDVSPGSDGGADGANVVNELDVGEPSLESPVQFTWNVTVIAAFGVSAALLAITTLSFFIFKTLRRHHRRFLVVNFAVATMLAQLCITLSSLVTTPEGCVLMAAFTSLFVMASFNWMLINVHVLYSVVSLGGGDGGGVMSTDRFKIFVGWAVPLCVAMTGVIVDQTASSVSGTGTVTTGCMFEGRLFWIIYAGPCLLSVVVAVLLLVAIFVKLRKRRRSYQVDQSKTQSNRKSTTLAIVGTAVYVFLMVLCWSSAALAKRNPGSAGVQGVAAFSGLLLGALLFTHQCLMCKDVREAWASVGQCGSKPRDRAESPYERNKPYHILEAPSTSSGVMAWDTADLSKASAVSVKSIAMSPLPKKGGSAQGGSGSRKQLFSVTSNQLLAQRLSHLDELGGESNADGGRALLLTMPPLDRATSDLLDRMVEDRKRVVQASPSDTYMEIGTLQAESNTYMTLGDIGSSKYSVNSPVEDTYMELGDVNSSDENDSNDDDIDKDYVSIDDFAMDTTMVNAGLEDIWDGALPIVADSQAASPAALTRQHATRRANVPVLPRENSTAGVGGTQIKMNYFNGGGRVTPSSHVDESSDASSDVEVEQLQAGTTPSPALSEIDQEYE